VAGEFELLDRTGQLEAGLEQDLEKDRVFRGVRGQVVEVRLKLCFQGFHGRRRRFAVPAFEVRGRELEDAEAEVDGG
jgi:hypothetical protein